MFVNTPVKVINESYREIGVEPIDFSIRSKIGMEGSGKDENEIKEAAGKLISNSESWSETIEDVRDKSVFNYMTSDKVGAKYILSRLK